MIESLTLSDSNPLHSYIATSTTHFKVALFGVYKCTCICEERVCMTVGLCSYVLVLKKESSVYT